MATKSIVYFRGSRADAMRIVNSLALVLTGREPDHRGIARGVFMAVGFQALSDIKADFVRKARGGTGEDGATWPKLAPATLAYGRRFGKGEESALKKAAGLGRAHRFAPGENKGLLTKEQLKRWNAIFAGTLHRLMVSLPEPMAKARAAAIAWAQLKREGAKTKLEVYGNRTVEILRDTGRLLASLSPGEITGGGVNTNYERPSGDGGEAQIFQTISNGIIVGSNLEYSRTHNDGDPSRNIPSRRFIPRQLPDVWRQRMLNVASQALAVGARMAFEVGA